jgi:hypothetical protein
VGGQITRQSEVHAQLEEDLAAFKKYTVATLEMQHEQGKRELRKRRMNYSFIRTSFMRTKANYDVSSCA